MYAELALGVAERGEQVELDARLCGERVLEVVQALGGRVEGAGRRPGPARQRRRPLPRRAQLAPQQRALRLRRRATGPTRLALAFPAVIKILLSVNYKQDVYNTTSNQNFLIYIIDIADLRTRILNRNTHVQWR